MVREKWSVSSFTQLPRAESATVSCSPLLTAHLPSILTCCSAFCSVLGMLSPLSPAEAIAAYDEALALQPGQAVVHASRAASHIKVRCTAGRLEPGRTAI